MDINGTLRVRELPSDKATNSIYNGKSSKTGTFTATKNVVVDDNGVLGVTEINKLRTKEISSSTSDLSTDKVIYDGYLFDGNSSITVTLPPPYRWKTNIFLCMGRILGCNLYLQREATRAIRKCKQFSNRGILE